MTPGDTIFPDDAGAGRDVIRRFWPPALTTTGDAFDDWSPPLAAALADVCAEAVGHRLEIAVSSDIAGTPPEQGWRRGDGLLAACGVDEALASAIASHRHGGAFEPNPGARLRPAHRRSGDAFFGGLLREALDRARPGAADWSPCTPDPSARALSVTLLHPDFAGTAWLALVLPGAAAGGDDERWGRELAAAVRGVEIVLRATIEHRCVDLAGALEWRPGGLVALAAPREVVLDAGSRRVARATLNIDGGVIGGATIAEMWPGGPGGGAR